MATPHLVDPIKAIDPIDALRLLVADVQALADRLGLKEKSRSLQQTLKATQERVFGPRAVVMLLAEDDAAKRRFLERLLGPDVARVPPPLDGCVRLEHGAEAECTITMPQGLSAVMPLEQLPQFLARRGGEMPPHSMQTVRLPNAALGRGLAVVDTPPLREGEPAPWLLESAEEADAWVLVLAADHAVSEPTLNLLCGLPRPATRLELVVEGAETLSGEERQVARQRLLNTLAQTCNLLEPRLTLLAGSRAEGESGSFWHGRFATFQSAALTRAKEHRLGETRSVVAEALTEVAAEIDFELQSTGIGIREARLRLGQKDLETLRTRFDELGLVAATPPRPTPSLVSAVIWPEEKPSLVNPPAPSRSARPALENPVVAIPAVAPAPSAPSASAHCSAAVTSRPKATPRSRAAALYSAAATALAASADSNAHSTDHASAVAGADALPHVSQDKPPARTVVAEQARSEQQRSKATQPDHATSVGKGRERHGEDAFVPADSPAARPPIERLHAFVEGLRLRLRQAMMMASVHFPPPTTASRERMVTIRWRIAAFAIVGAIVWLMLWAMWPRDHVYTPEPAAQWIPDEDTRAPRGERTTTAGLGAGDAANAANRHSRRSPEVIAEPSYSGLNLGAPPVQAAPRETHEDQTAVATDPPLTKPSAAKTFLPGDPGSPTSNSPVNSHKKRNGFLGLKRAWHWVHRGDADQAAPAPTEVRAQ